LTEVHVKLLRLLLPLALLSTTLLLAPAGFVVHAQSAKGIISGLVVDATGAAVPGAGIKLTPLGITAVSGAQGAYTLYDVPPGTYTVTGTYVGFEPFQKTAVVTAGQTLNLDLTLQVASSSQQVLVTAPRAHGEAMAINETRTADNLLQVLPASVITSLPNANAADAIGRMPSVTLYRIEGEGVYIQVRGTEPRLTNVTVDGVTLPAPEPTVRQVRLDVIPSDMIEATELNKTLSANMDANGIGGSANLVTKEATEVPTIDLYGNGGYTNILNGRDNYGYGGTVGKRFGVNKKLGLLGNAVLDYNGRGIDNIQPALDPLSTFATPFYDDDTIREYRYYRTRFGFSGSADYRFNDADSIYAHGFYSDLKDWGDKWYYEPVSTPITAAGVLPNPATASPSPKFYTSSKRPNAAVSTLIVGGRHAQGTYLITYQLSASRSYEVDSAGNPKADFSWVGPAVYCNYVPSAQTNVYRPRFGVCDGPSSPLQNANDWVFKDITISKGLNAQLNLAASANLTKHYNAHSHFGTFAMGFKISNAHQTQDSTETVYDGWSTKNNPAILMSGLLDTFNNTDYYNGTYFGGHYGPVSNFTTAETYTLANFSGNVDGYKTALDQYPNIFHTIERIPAGYVMNTTDLGKLHIQAGLRFEATQMDTFGYEVTLYAANNPKCGAAPNTGCGVPTGIPNNPSYLDVLPSIETRYPLTANSDLRAVFSRGVARPDPYQLVPYLTEDDTASPITVAVGNPNLKPEHANNYDLLYEDFLEPLGMIQAGFFFKQLNAPQLETILPASVNLSTLPPGDVSPILQQNLAAYSGDTVTQFINGQNAYLGGIELSFQQHMSYLPGILSGFGISANYSYTFSREKGLPLRFDHPTLIDQAANTWNVGPTYDTKRISARLGLAYNGPSLFTYNYVSPTALPVPPVGTLSTDPNNLGPGGPTGDIFTMAHYQVDAQASYRFYRGLSAVVSGLNLNNEVFGYYQGSTQFVNQREYYKPTYNGGLRYVFSREH
jgi:TonB-dependent receptor